MVLSGGSFDSAGAFAKAHYTWGRNSLGVSASGSMTDHYLNPVVPENYSNTGTLGDFSVNYERDLTSKDRIRFIVRHELSRYDIPNELVQQAAGQLQQADNIETMGTVSYQHTFSSNAVADFRGMVRDNANDFNSNPNPLPSRSFSTIAFVKDISRGQGRSIMDGTNGSSGWSPTIPFCMKTSATTLPIQRNLMMVRLLHLAS